MTFSLDDVVALDVHVHEHNENEPQDLETAEVLDAPAQYLGGHPPQPTATEVAPSYRERKLLAVIFNVDIEQGLRGFEVAEFRLSTPTRSVWTMTRRAFPRWTSTRPSGVSSAGLGPSARDSRSQDESLHRRIRLVTKVFLENLIRYTNTQLKHGMLFCSDHPLITPHRWLADFEKVPIRIGYALRGTPSGP